MSDSEATSSSRAAAPGLSREELEKALEGQSAEQLQEMGRRLLKSQEAMTEMLEELEAESSMLEEESLDLNETIDLMMKELQKLGIGAMNTVEPRLEGDNPMAFVGRYWEKIKPRDSAYQTSDHVGEIRKPTPDSMQPPTAQDIAQEVAQHATQQAKQTAQRLQGALGPLWQRTQGFLNEKQTELNQAVARANQRARAQVEQQKSSASKSKTQRSERASNERTSRAAGKKVEQSRGAANSSSSSTAPVVAPIAAPAPTPAVVSPKGKVAQAEREASASCTGSSATPSPPAVEEVAASSSTAAAAPPAPVENAAAAVATASLAAAAAAAAAAAPAAAPPSAAAAAAASAASASEGAPPAPAPVAPAPTKAGPAADPLPGAEEQADNTLLIEAHLTTEDCKVLTLQVKAADRPKEVSQRFVQQHALKAWYQDPLTTWLKKVEADAVKFPVKVEGNLLEIRKQFSKSKA